MVSTYFEEIAMKKKIKIPTKDMKDLKPISTIEFQVVTGQLSLSDILIYHSAVQSAQRAGKTKNSPVE